ncbi:MAG: flagellar motor protein MotB [Lachnospiraceae bacterium]|nr:flagellar motor protein MotB [Lachnospiraceae bacterium]
MARKSQEDPPKGSPAWMATFSDLMNLLLCFFVLLFSMSTVDAEKFVMVIASLQNTFSVLPAGGSSIGEGEMVGAGISQLKDLDIFFQEANSEGEEQGGAADGDNDVEPEAVNPEDVKEQYREEALNESQEMAEQLEEKLAEYGIQDQVEVDFNADYVLLTLNGAVLFDSGKAEVRDEAKELLVKLSAVLEQYDKNIIEVEGHTDNVPMHSAKYEDNDVLSMYRALSVANIIRENSDLNPALIKSAGRGEYVPIADNSTPEGRARNRRAEIKVYNSYSSGDVTE